MTGDTPSEWQYVAAAYLVVFVAVLLWVAIIAAKLQRLQREVGELVEQRARARRRWLRRSSGRRCSATARRRSPTRRRAAHALGDLGRAGRLARADGAARRAGRAHRRLPVVDLGRLAQPLRLARRRRLPDLGLPAALPAARSRRDAARGGALRRRARRRRHRAPASGSRLRQPLPRRCTSASCSPRSPASRSRRRSPALYLWEERRLQRRAADILRLRLPPLASLERLTWRTIAVSLPLLTLGLAAGVIRLRQRRRRARRARGGDAPRPGSSTARSSSRGRPAAAAAYLALVGFALVIVVRIALAGSHFIDALARRPLAPRRAGRAARARGARRSTARRRARARARRRRLPLDLQPHRALPRRRATTRRALATLEELAGEPLDGGRLPPARRGGGAAPLPRRRRARLARAGRGRDPRPGARGLRGRVAGAAARPRLPPGARSRQARAHGDGDRREPGVGLVRGGRARGSRSSATSPGGACC